MLKWEPPELTAEELAQLRGLADGTLDCCENCKIGSSDCDVNPLAAVRVHDREEAKKLLAMYEANR